MLMLSLATELAVSIFVGVVLPQALLSRLSAVETLPVAALPVETPPVEAEPPLDGGFADHASLAVVGAVGVERDQASPLWGPLGAERDQASLFWGVDAAGTTGGTVTTGSGDGIGST
jgi:hypothetical protein